MARRDRPRLWVHRVVDLGVGRLGVASTTESQTTALEVIAWTGCGRRDGAGCCRAAALIASTRKARIDLPCARRLSQTVSYQARLNSTTRHELSRDEPGALSDIGLAVVGFVPGVGELPGGTHGSEGRATSPSSGRAS